MTSSLILARRMGVATGALGGLAAGMDAMAEYALGAVDDDVDAIGEEDAAIVASRKAFRPSRTSSG